MDKLERKALTTARGLRYTYYASTPASESSRPALLFCHGFPNSASLWNDVVVYLSSSGILNEYKIVVPDMLGYAGTQKPLETTLYNARGMSDDLVDILDAENVQKVIAIGHDWGSYMVQRFYAFHTEKVEKLVLLNIAYYPPSKPGNSRFDLEAVNEQFEADFGAPLWAYWEFLTSQDGPRLMRENLQKVWEVEHGNPKDWRFQMFCVPEAQRKYVTGSQTVSLKSYATAEMKAEFIEQFERDGFEAPVQWYHAFTKNVQHDAEMTIPSERHTIMVLLLFVGCTKDANNRIEMSDVASKAGLLPYLTTEILDCAHWTPLEMPAEVADLITKFIG